MQNSVPNKIKKFLLFCLTLTTISSLPAQKSTVYQLMTSGIPNVYLVVCIKEEIKQTYCNGFKIKKQQGVYTSAHCVCDCDRIEIRASGNQNYSFIIEPNDQTILFSQKSDIALIRKDLTRINLKSEFNYQTDDQLLLEYINSPYTGFTYENLSGETQLTASFCNIAFGMKVQNTSLEYRNLNDIEFNIADLRARNTDSYGFSPRQINELKEIEGNTGNKIFIFEDTKIKKGYSGAPLISNNQRKKSVIGLISSGIKNVNTNVGYLNYTVGLKINNIKWVNEPRNCKVSSYLYSSLAESLTPPNRFLSQVDSVRNFPKEEVYMQSYFLNKKEKELLKAYKNNEVKHTSWTSKDFKKRFKRLVFKKNDENKKKIRSSASHFAQYIFYSSIVDIVGYKDLINGDYLTPKWKELSKLYFEANEEDSLKSSRHFLREADGYYMKELLQTFYGNEYLNKIKESLLKNSKSLEDSIITLITVRDSLSTIYNGIHESTRGKELEEEMFSKLNESENSGIQLGQQIEQLNCRLLNKMISQFGIKARDVKKGEKFTEKVNELSTLFDTIRWSYSISQNCIEDSIFRNLRFKLEKLLKISQEDTTQSVQLFHVVDSIAKKIFGKTGVSTKLRTGLNYEREINITSDTSINLSFIISENNNRNVEKLYNISQYKEGQILSKNAVIVGDMINQFVDSLMLELKRRSFKSLFKVKVGGMADGIPYRGKFKYNKSSYKKKDLKNMEALLITNGSCYPSIFDNQTMERRLYSSLKENNEKLAFFRALELKDILGIKNHVKTELYVVHVDEKDGECRRTEVSIDIKVLD